MALREAVVTTKPPPDPYEEYEHASGRYVEDICRLNAENRKLKEWVEMLWKALLSA